MTITDYAGDPLPNWEQFCNQSAITPHEGTGGVIIWEDNFYGIQHGVLKAILPSIVPEKQEEFQKLLAELDEKSYK